MHPATSIRHLFRNRNIVPYPINIYPLILLNVQVPRSRCLTIYHLKTIVIYPYLRSLQLARTFRSSGNLIAVNKETGARWQKLDSIDMPFFDINFRQMLLELYITIASNHNLKTRCITSG